MMSGGYFNKEAVYTKTGENYLRKYWNMVGRHVVIPDMIM